MDSGLATRHSLALKARTHLRLARKPLAWPVFLTLLAGPALLPWPWDTPEFERYALLYGAFLAPLMAAWVIPRLILADASRELVAAAKAGLPRIAAERLCLYLVAFEVLWTLFLGVFWAVYTFRIADSDLPAVTLDTMLRLWTSGAAGLLFFVACGFMFGSWNGVQTGGLLVSGLWILGIYIGNASPDASVLTPFLGFFDLYSESFWVQHGTLAAFSLLLLWVGAWHLSGRGMTGPGRRLPLLAASGPVEGLQGEWGSSGRGFPTLVRVELHRALRRKALWVYAGVPTGLLLLLSADGQMTLDIFLPAVLSNLLFAGPPLLALFFGPVLTRNGSERYNWFWGTPVVWAKPLWAQLVTYGTIAVLLVTALTAFALVPVALRDRWSWVQVTEVLWPFWALFTVATAGQVLVIGGLALILRHSLAVFAVACALVVSLYLGFLTSTLTLFNVRDFTLSSVFFSSMTGFAPDFGPALRLVLLLLAGGLLLWCVALALYPHRERRATWTRSGQWRTTVAAGAGGLLVLAASLGFASGSDGGRVPGSVDEPGDTWSVRVADHRAHLLDGEIAVESRLTLVPAPGQPSGDVALRLNPGLHMREAVWANQQLTWERQGEVMRISLPGAAQSDGIELSLRYEGRPVLPREDYVLTNTAVAYGPASVRHVPRESVSYANDRFLQWFRDSDWTAWPVTGGFQMATQDNTWEIALPRDAYPHVFSSAASDRPDGDWVHFHWQGVPPSVLLVAGAYQSAETDHGALVWQGPYQSRIDRTRAAAVLQAQARLPELGVADSARPQVVYFPFGHRVHFSDSTVFLPAGPAVYLPQTDSELLVMTVRLAEDWLREYVAWRTPPVSQEGLVRFPAVVCDFEVVNRTQLCELANRFVRNPQAPRGRTGPNEFCLYPKSVDCGAIAPLRRALAIGLAYHVLADPAWVHDEWERWHHIAHNAGLPEHDVDLAGTLRSPLHDVCTMTDHLLTLHELVEHHGTDFLRRWVVLMAERHPPGGGSPVDEVAWELAAELLGMQIVPHTDSACITWTLKEEA